MTMKLGIICDYDENGFKQAKDLGLEFIEICYNIGNDCEEFKKEILPALLLRTKKYGVAIGSIGRWGSSKIDDNGNIIEDELHNSQLLIDACYELGCNVFVTGVNYVDGFSLYENCTFAIAFLEKLIAYGKEKNVNIAVYNCDWNNFIREPHSWELILGYLKELGIKYDPSHCINSGSGKYIDETAKWGKRFYHVHIKGTLNTAESGHIDDPPAGLDDINWGAFMSVLYKVGYERTLSIEPHSGTWKGGLGDWGVKFTVDYINKLVYKGAK